MTIVDAVDEAFRHYGGTAKMSKIVYYIGQKYPSINPVSVRRAIYYGSNQNPRTGFRYDRVGYGVYKLNDSDGT